MKWETSLTERALQGTLIMVIVELFMGGNLGVRIALDALGVPSEGWIQVIYETWTPTQLPAYLFEFGLIFGALSVYAAFFKMVLPDELIETLGLQRGVSSLTDADWVIIGIWIVLSVPVAMMIDYPLELVPILQGVLFVGLQIAYLSIPSFLHEFFRLPDSTTNMGLVVLIITISFVFAILLTHLFLLPIRALEFYAV